MTMWNIHRLLKIRSLLTTVAMNERDTLLSPGNGVSVIIFLYYTFQGTVVVMIAWKLDLQLPMQSVPITTKVVSSKHYVIKFVSDLRQVGDFLRVLRFPPPIKLTATK